MNDRLFVGDLDALDLFELLDAALHLLGLSGLVAEAVDEGFELLDALALVAIGGFDLGAALGFLLEVLLVIAVVDVQALVPDLDDLVDGDVEEVAVVRDEDVSVGIGAQIVLEPVAGFEVEMVRRLVEQKQAGLLQQQFGEGDAHLPSAGKLFSPATPVFFREPEAGEDGPDLRVQCVTVVGTKSGVDLGEAVGSGGVGVAFRVEFGERGGDRLHLFFEAEKLVEDRQAFVEDGAAREREAVLREVSDAHAAGALDLAVVEAVEAGEDLHQRGFAGAVGTDQSGLLVRGDQPVGVLEKQFRAKSLARIGELQHRIYFNGGLRVQRSAPSAPYKEGARWYRRSVFRTVCRYVADLVACGFGCFLVVALVAAGTVFLACFFADLFSFTGALFFTGTLRAIFSSSQSFSVWSA